LAAGDVGEADWGALVDRHVAVFPGPLVDVLGQVLEHAQHVVVSLPELVDQGALHPRRVVRL
jgi:hypothetical protein